METDGVAGGDGGAERETLLHRQQQVFNSASPVAQVLSFWKGTTLGAAPPSSFLDLGFGGLLWFCEIVLLILGFSVLAGSSVSFCELFTMWVSVGVVIWFLGGFSLSSTLSSDRMQL